MNTTIKGINVHGEAKLTVTSTSIKSNVPFVPRITGGVLEIGGCIGINGNKIGSMSTSCGHLGEIRITNNVYFISFTPRRLVVRGVDFTYLIDSSFRRPDSMPQMNNNIDGNCYNYSLYSSDGCVIVTGSLKYVEHTGVLSFASTGDMAGLVIAGKDVFPDIARAAGLEEFIEAQKKLMITEFPAEIKLSAIELNGNSGLTVSGDALNDENIVIKTFGDSKLRCHDAIKLQRLRIYANMKSEVWFSKREDSTVRKLYIDAPSNGSVLICASCQDAKINASMNSTVELVCQEQLVDLEVYATVRARVTFRKSKIPAHANLTASMSSEILGVDGTYAVDPNTVVKDVASWGAMISGIKGL